ncbi:ADP-ribosylation factor GTPase activating protein [Trypanosoma grayi]|uniref:ADP-ribosylation factor GTPase activating protein n=1 Tax=Trypanosoma grayi TaxID=71804 RepID=UPI0004F4A7D1|nr:ADP-ribosylation factor GTPase activating protein [Trypanosoma grayi]KEG10601.1 ADP-ribosylation factor GTPase activating protein [Trypanosoma grayi]
MNLRTRKVERNRDEVRQLSQKGENRFCFDCGIRGPLYAVTNFHIFVCSTCAALHRSLQHKVKGISMTEFSDDEVTGLQVGGNDSAAKAWLPNYNRSLPTHGNDIIIKEFIVAVFDNMRYADREKVDQLRRDVQRAIKNEPAQPRLTSLPPTNRTQQQQQQPPPPQQQPPSPPQSQPQPPPQQQQPSNWKSVPPAQKPPSDWFGQSGSQAPQTTATVADPAAQKNNDDDDVFDDFFTAAPPAATTAAPSPSTTTASAATPQSTLVDLFSSVPLADPRASQTPYGCPGPAGVQVPYPPPQGFSNMQAQYPATMPHQPEMQYYAGMNEGGHNFPPYAYYPQQQQPVLVQPPQQQPQYNFPTGAPAPPIVLLSKTAAAPGPKPLAYGTTPADLNNVNFFQAPPTDPWLTPATPPPVKMEAEQQSNEGQKDVFASLNPFGGNR